ncbi:UDP-glucose/GDP-mannose dehydrogenase family, UDP binding domain [compost metagenome]
MDIIRELGEYHISADVYDPWVSASEAQHEYGIIPINEPAIEAYDGIILAVAHDEFRSLGAANIRRYGKAEHVLYDLKYLLAPNESDLRL